MFFTLQCRKTSGEIIIKKETKTTQNPTKPFM